VVSYCPTLAAKPLSCHLDHCEMFLCILGMEDETAVSISDPVNMNMKVKGIAPSDRVLKVSSSVRLNLS
jgi:hypothetical protein